jgi:hypothetical protein
MTVPSPRSLYTGPPLSPGRAAVCPFCCSASHSRWESVHSNRTLRLHTGPPTASALVFPDWHRISPTNGAPPLVTVRWVELSRPPM